MPRRWNVELHIKLVTLENRMKLNILLTMSDHFKPVTERKDQSALGKLTMGVSISR